MRDTILRRFLEVETEGAHSPQIDASCVGRSSRYVVIPSLHLRVLEKRSITVATRAYHNVLDSPVAKISWDLNRNRSGPGETRIS